jgi:cytochrome c biogenesis protein CcmG/thiol:disulfide interchange protein DsbE
MSNRFWLGILVVIIIIAGIGYSYLFGNGKESTAKLVVQEEQKNEDQKYPLAPDFNLKDLDGNSVRLSDFRGKIVIIDFWATWCPPCRKGIPEFVELQEEYGNDKLVVLGLNMDQGDLSVVPKFADDYKINYPILYVTPQVVADYGGIRGIPTTFVIDKEGYVRHGVQGYQPKESFIQVIEILL